LPSSTSIITAVITDALEVDDAVLVRNQGYSASDGLIGHQRLQVRLDSIRLRRFAGNGRALRAGSQRNSDEKRRYCKLLFHKASIRKPAGTAWFLAFQLRVLDYQLLVLIIFVEALQSLRPFPVKLKKLLTFQCRVLASQALLI
jgi:hypothetical protein